MKTTAPILLAIAIAGAALSAPGPTSDVQTLSQPRVHQLGPPAGPNQWRLVDPLTPGPGGERGLSGPPVPSFPNLPDPGTPPSVGGTHQEFRYPGAVGQGR